MLVSVVLDENMNKVSISEIQKEDIFKVLSATPINGITCVLNLETDFDCVIQDVKDLKSDELSEFLYYANIDGTMIAKYDSSVFKS